jgi:hypothetical protein
MLSPSGLVDTGLMEKTMVQRRRYLSYLLRLWQESGGPTDCGGHRPLWRASLERPQEGERLGFASLEDLFAFLEDETGASSPGLERGDEGGRQSPGIPE